MNFSEKFLELRKQKGYSQEELSYKLNVARQTISKWESGVTTPDMENLIKISNIFNVSIDELLENKIMNNEIQNENSNNKQKQVSIEENLEARDIIESDIVSEKSKSKSKLKKLFKIVAIVILLIIIIVLIYLCKVVYDRYNLLTMVYLNFSDFHYKDMKNCDYQNIINKTYTKENYELENALMYRKIREMEYKLDYKLNLSSGWGRLFLACNYFYKIYLREINKEQDIIIEPRYMKNYKDMIQVRASYLCNSNPYLNYAMDTYKDNQHIRELHEWSPEEEQYAENWILELPDLTEYILIEK